MKVVIAIDSFKGSLSSKELALNIHSGISKVYPNAQVECLPIADGGEGTIEALVDTLSGKLVYLTVHDPLMRPINAKYCIADNTAIIEMAKASGLPLLLSNEHNPMITNTFGTGELIKDAIERGCKKLIVGIGGSATNDAGMGMLQALGYKFYDSSGNELGYGGQQLSEITHIDDKHITPGIENCEFIVACDVDNPLYGQHGAAHVYAAQKGADQNMIKELDKGLRHFSKVILKLTGQHIADTPGAGAAGGVGAALLAFLNAKLKPGIDIILDLIHLEDKVKDADFVITGEGKIDNQSTHGKAPIGVALRCKKHNVPVIALSGQLAQNIGNIHDQGINAAFSIISSPSTLEEAINNAPQLVENSTEQIFRLIKCCKG